MKTHQTGTVYVNRMNWNVHYTLLAKVKLLFYPLLLFVLPLRYLFLTSKRGEKDM